MRLVESNQPHMFPMCELKVGEVGVVVDGSQERLTRDYAGKVVVRDTSGNFIVIGQENDGSPVWFSEVTNSLTVRKLQKGETLVID